MLQRSSEQSLLQTENKNNDMGEISSIEYISYLCCAGLLSLYFFCCQIKKKKKEDNICGAYLRNGFKLPNMSCGCFYNFYKQEILVQLLINVGYLNQYSKPLL